MLLRLRGENPNHKTSVYIGAGHVTDKDLSNCGLLTVLFGDAENENIQGICGTWFLSRKKEETKQVFPDRICRLLSLQAMVIHLKSTTTTRCNRVTL